ncbi:MAG: DUF5916 domain-containing protein, partial [Gemmatimonadetes bacterium]|nr:DUF5916 domain-containing protein [Gemmatimonadota bacterium]
MALLAGVPALSAQQLRSAAPVAAWPTLRVGRAAAAVRLDGRLDDPVWATADSIDGLTQVEPREGGPASSRTVVKVLLQGSALVIGVRAEDPDPSRITAFVRDRDASQANEDHIRIVLDTYLNGRSGYVFSVNPNGARYDALVASQGASENADWDAVWESAVARSASGWSAEIRIPAKSLLFGRGLTEWGFNVQRRVQRLQEVSRWASANRDTKINMTSRAGRLVDLPLLALGAGLSIRPSIVERGGIATAGGQFTGTRDASLDVTQRLGANALASLTVNTDFGETEVDTRRSNLTRFPLFFPEKRSFFLEGSDIFDFGLGLGTSSGQSGDVLPFFSRRIGLLNGQGVPLRGGLKVNGRARGTNYGALVVRTGGVDTLPTGTELAVIRVQRNVLSESTVGAIATLGDPTGRGRSWLAGTDLTYQTTHFRGNKNLLAGAWALQANRDGLTGRRSAFGAKIDMPNDLLNVAVSYKWIGDGFDPSLGFVPRRGVQILNANAVYQPRPKAPILGLRVRQMFNESLNTLVTDLHGRWESYRVFTAPVNWRLESGDRLEFNVAPAGERLTAPFEIAKGVTIPAGSYHWTRWRLEGGLAAKR